MQTDGLFVDGSRSNSSSFCDVLEYGREGLVARGSLTVRAGGLCIDCLRVMFRRVECKLPLLLL